MSGEEEQAAWFAVAFAEGEVEVYRCASEAEADGFARGYVDGACAYGAGSVAVYVLPKDERSMVDEQNATTVAHARAMIEKARW